MVAVLISHGEILRTNPYDEGSSGDRPDRYTAEFSDERTDGQFTVQVDRAQEVTRKRFGSGDEGNGFGTDSKGESDAADSFGERRACHEWLDSIAAMVYEPMSRRVVNRFAVTGIVLTVVGLLLRPLSIGAAVGAFLLAIGLFGLAGYGVLDRLVDRWKQSHR